MKYQEFGAKNRDTLILLHGGGLSWWNYREEAEMLQSEYRVILPILDGHAGSDRPFTTIESNAAEIISFIDEQLGGSVLLMGGLSLGGQILLEMLAQRKGICRCALVESAPVLPDRLTHALIAPTFGSSYGLIRNKSFAKLQFQSLHIQPALFDDYYRDTCQIKKADMIAFLKANTGYSLKKSIESCSSQVRVIVGGKENWRVLKSAKLIEKAVPGCTMEVLPGFRHGAFSLNHAGDYVHTICDILGTTNTKAIRGSPMKTAGNT